MWVCESRYFSPFLAAYEVFTKALGHMDSKTRWEVVQTENKEDVPAPTAPDLWEWIIEMARVDIV